MAITVDDIKTMPTKYKILLGIVLILVVGYLYYTYFYQAALEKRAKLTQTLESLETQIAAREKVAQQIEQHKKDIAALQEHLRVALAKLPEQKEIPGLLASVSEAGREEGLEFLLFEPSTPISKEFYAAIPVKVQVKGKYQELIAFFERVAKLPRIVNTADLTIERGKDSESGKNQLMAKCSIETYMFVEQPATDEKKNEKKKS